MLKRTLQTIGRIQTRLINSKIKRTNAKNKKKGVELVYAQAEQLPVKNIFRSIKNGLVLNPNKPEYCAAYATRIAKQLFKKEFVRAHAWELAYKNRVTYESRFNPKTLKGELTKRQLNLFIEREVIKPGTILGVYYPQSGYNHTQRRVTHAMLYIGEGKFWHNFYGPKIIALQEIYSTKEKGKRVLYPVQIIEPKGTILK
ncbi:MAG: hypothetical protein PHD80_03500 [Candidatus ainarchaeum sp.]|nr:hypothetical protein [Candidatus ainarchaeum sp.]